MKKLSLITLALLTLLLAQCKKEKFDSNGTNANKVMVRCDVTMGNGEKTDFTDPLISSGSIKWSTGTEYLYLVVNGSNSQIIELSANNETGESVTTLSFSGTMSADIISEGNTYQIWYFGNSHKLGEDSYVTKTPSDNNVITQIDGSIATQSGKLSDLGYHHIAMASATAQVVNDQVVLSIADGEGLQSQIAIAYMDLSKSAKLEGNAIVGTAFSLKNTDGTYKFEINADNKVININNTDGSLNKSYVVLLPNDNENVDILNINTDTEQFCKHTFENGIAANTFYYKYLSELENATLKWEYYPFVNGYEFVDFGLPSGTKWAKYNVGVDPANLINQHYFYGNYYQWGATGNSEYNESSYTGNDDISQTEYDAATVNWGDGWCMPTKAQMQELVENCDWEIVESYENISGLHGFKVTRVEYTESHIFFPIYRRKINETHYFNEYFWSSTPSDNNSTSPYYLSLKEEGEEGENNCEVVNSYMEEGFFCKIRPVVVPPSNSNK